MRIILTILLGLITIINRCQVPDFIWTIHYENPNPNAFEYIKSICNEVDTISVNASLVGNCSIDINNQVIIEPEFNDWAGAVVTYLPDGSVQDHKSISSGGIYYSKKKDNGSYTIIGSFSDSVDFDFSNQEYFINSTSLSNGFVTDNSISGELNQISYGKYTIQDVAFMESGYFVVANFSNATQIIDLTDTLNIPNNGLDGSEALILKYDENNQLLNFKLNEADGSNGNYGTAFSSAVNELTVVGLGTGSQDYQWQGIDSFTIIHEDDEPFAVTYNSNLELTSFIRMVYQGDLDSYSSRFTSCVYDKDGNLYIGGCVFGGSNVLELNDISIPVELNGVFSLIVIKLNASKELLWIRTMPVDNFCYINKLRTDNNGFIQACGKFDTSMEFEGTPTTLTGPSESGFIARWTPEGELVWAYTISDGGNTSVNDICITPNNEMYIGGWFTTYSTDFDFDENTSFDLGTTNGEDAFLAKYTLSDPQADVFVEQGWQTTEATEGGASDVLYVRLSHTPASPVEVVLTSSAQIDLGNGAGNAITLNFAADATAVQQQVVNVTAFDDIVVEGAHTGNISFTINSPDVAFDVLTENSITVAITDNDYIGISETRQNLFSLSPNPAEDILNVTFTQYQNNTVLHIYNESGQLVTTAKANGKSSAIDISKLAAGHYTMVMQNGSEKSRVVFVKM